MGPEESKKMTCNPNYELERIENEALFYRKMLTKRLLQKIVGELYVGRRIKMVYFKRWLERIRPAQKARILELGSGDGAFTFFVCKEFKQAIVTGLELNPIEAAVCERLARKEQIPNLGFECGTLSTVNWTQKFDFIYCLDVLEHIPDDMKAIAEMYDALCSGGDVLIHVPNRSFMETNGKLVTIPDDEAWKVNPGHVRNGYSPDELKEKLERAGFSVQKIQQTQGHAATWAFRIYATIEKYLPLRMAILPIVDILAWIDAKKSPVHGNTVWAWAKRI